MASPTVEEAAEKLQEILGRIKQGLSAQELSRISDELVSFANPASAYHVPSRPSYAELRETALAASNELQRGLSSAALARIRSRAAALARHVTAVRMVTEEAENQVKALYIEKKRSETVPRKNDSEEGLSIQVVVPDSASEKQVTEELIDLFQSLNEYHIAYGGNGLKIEDFQTFVRDGILVGAGQ